MIFHINGKRENSFSLVYLVPQLTRRNVSAKMSQKEEGGIESPEMTSRRNRPQKRHPLTPPLQMNQTTRNHFSTKVNHGSKYITTFLSLLLLHCIFSIIILAFRNRVMFTFKSFAFRIKFHSHSKNIE
jgi:hypothetical protein